MLLQEKVIKHHAFCLEPIVSFALFAPGKDIISTVLWVVLDDKKLSIFPIAISVSLEVGPPDPHKLCADGQRNS